MMQYSISGAGHHACINVDLTECDLSMVGATVVMESPVGDAIVALGFPTSCCESMLQVGVSLEVCAQLVVNLNRLLTDHRPDVILEAIDRMNQQVDESIESVVDWDPDEVDWSEVSPEPMEEQAGREGAREGAYLWCEYGHPPVAMLSHPTIPIMRCPECGRFEDR